MNIPSNYPECSLLLPAVLNVIRQTCLMPHPCECRSWHWFCYYVCRILIPWYPVYCDISVFSGFSHTVMLAPDMVAMLAQVVVVGQCRCPSVVCPDLRDAGDLQELQYLP